MERKVRILVVAATVAVVVWLVAGVGIARADDEKITPPWQPVTQRSTNNQQVYGADVQSYALATSLGDVDIAQCMASTQWSAVIVSQQKVKLNKWCAADGLDQKGMHEQAARMRCTIPEVKRLYRTNGRLFWSRYDLTNCEADWMYVPMHQPDEAEAIRLDSELVGAVQSLEERYKEATEEYGEDIAEIEARLAKVEQKAPVRQQVVRSYGITEEQRIALAKVFEDE